MWQNRRRVRPEVATHCVKDTGEVISITGISFDIITRESNIADFIILVTTFVSFSFIICFTPSMWTALLKRSQNLALRIYARATNI